MRVPDLELLIDDSEKNSPDYVSDEDRDKLLNAERWKQWAEYQLSEAEKEQQKRQYEPEVVRPIDLLPGSSPMAGREFWIETSSSSNGRWVDNVPVTLTAPQAHTKLIMPKIGFSS